MRFAPRAIYFYARARDVDPRVAELELEELFDLAELKIEERGETPASYRYRSRAAGVDITFRSRGDTVISVSVRDYRSVARGGKKKPRLG